jgi:membrane protein implicated in regulation of membrane protease activity
MSPDTITWLWLLGGIILLASELLLPGLVAMFLGLGALVVALLRWLGLIDSLAYSFTA